MVKPAIAARGAPTAPRRGAPRAGGDVGAAGAAPACGSAMGGILALAGDVSGTPTPGACAGTDGLGETTPDLTVLKTPQSGSPTVPPAELLRV